METAVKLQNEGYRVVLVSSGAIGVGVQRMNIKERPQELASRQALAAIGQCRLMSLWDQLFQHFRQPVAQVLLTRNDIADRTQYINAQRTFSKLFEFGVIPIVNENDTVAVSEIKFGDNDTLSAITAAMVQADYLFLMTDVDCLYEKNPRTHQDAKPIEVVENIDNLEIDVSSSGSSLGTGGMFTKIVAARRATSVGITVVITRSSLPGNIRSIITYIEAQKARKDDTSGTITTNGIPGSLSVPLHTRFLPSQRPIRDQKFWLLHIYSPSGNIYIDEQAHDHLKDKANLFPAGVVDVDGSFAPQEAVRIFVIKRPFRTNSLTSDAKIPTYEQMDPPPVEVGRAIVNFSSSEVKLIRGLKGADIATVLESPDSEYVAHRQNIALFDTVPTRPATPIFDIPS